MTKSTKFIFVTGGVLSSLGKGISSASVGTLLKHCGLDVTILKMDPYLNVDPGTMSPLEHGEVFVTFDGGETDLDIGHYERFLDENISKKNNFTAGQIYKTVFNQRWAEIMGYRLEEFGETTIKTWENFIHPDDLKISKMLLQKHFSGESDYYSYECRVKHKDGNWRWILDSGRVVEWDKDGLPLIMFGTHQDITEKKILENKIRENSIRDPLTQIYNRRYVFDRMTAIVAEYIRNGYMFSVAIIDIDYFKLINDKYGHQAGDQVLIEFTQIISNGLRPYDILGRYGGEEFIIVSVNTTSEHLKIAIERILEKIRKIEINYKGNKINFTFSTGIADGNDFIEEDLTVDRAVELADRRLYKAKQKGRNRIEI